MDQISRIACAAVAFCLPALLTVSTAFGQAQLGPPQAFPQTSTPVQPGVPPQAPAVPQAPDEFSLNALEQAELDRVLDAWQASSGKIETFRCEFERWEYNAAFGPKNKDIPLNKNHGQLSYQKPDKGSFEISKISTFQAEPVPPGQTPPAVIKGDWVEQPNAIGEHWVCDGKSIYEYRQQDKQLVERPIPPQLQGQAIVDGPLPFLFGAEAAKLKQRYKLRILQQDNNQVWLKAKPKFQEQAADFSEVIVILNRQQLLPEAMRVTMPNGDWHDYMFDVTTAKKNGPVNWLKGFFDQPRMQFGWKHVVENMPLAQAPQAVQQAR
ncbi:MAG: TIGR03009 domain-containing protein [Pirellulales bacterium]